jgi:outer membrane protein assembly factor BamE
MIRKKIEEMRLIRSVFLLGVLGASLCSLHGCSTWNPYRPEIHQGNIITPEQISRLTVGMTPVQVQAILGASVTQDVFQAQRWDYIYYANRQGNQIAPRRLTLWFEGEKLARWESDGLPGTIPSPNVSASDEPVSVQSPSSVGK